MHHFFLKSLAINYPHWFMRTLIRILRIEREDNIDSKGQGEIVNNTEGNIICYWIGNPEAS